MEEFSVAVQCRACLSTNSAEYIDMESSMAGEYSYLECFNFCTNLKASTADQLPIIICTVCSHDLQIAFDFVQVARQADAVLRQNQADKFKVEHCEERELEYIDGGEDLITGENVDKEDEHMLEMEVVDDEVEEMELIAPDEAEDPYRELETFQEQDVEGSELEQEFLEEKPLVVEFDIQQQLNETAKECNSKLNNLKEEQKETQESYPEDEIDDEYLLEHNETAEDESAQGWKCFECKRMLHADVSYEGHLNMHKNVKPYKCTHCRSTFRCRNALEYHASKRHDHGKTAQKCFTCDICDKPFRLATLLLEHRRSEHKTLLNCSKCTKSFKLQELLDDHMILIHPPTNTTPIQCPFCAQPPLIKARLVEHLRQQHPAEHRKHLHTVGRPCDENKVTPWQCEECFRYYRTETLLKDHSNTHSNERPHSCSVCDKRFFTANNLRGHMRSMHQSEYTEKRMAESVDNFVKCEVCKKKLLQKNLEKHMLTHERKEKQAESAGDGSTATYLCAYCPRECRSQKTLNQHQKLHQIQESGIIYECTECQRQYATQQHLEQHRKQAHKERDNVCAICSNAFKLKNQLVNHMKLHLEKNIACPKCDKKYARQFDLNVHMRTHTGELPFACHLCEKRFAIKVRLTYHLQKHLGIKHRCKECGAEFNSKQKLKAHSYKHTGMPYRCEMCDNHGFANRDVFKRHLLRVHNATMSDEDLVEMFQRNTGKSTRILQIEDMEHLVQKPSQIEKSNLKYDDDDASFLYNSELSMVEEEVV